MNLFVIMVMILSFGCNVAAEAQANQRQLKLPTEKISDKLDNQMQLSTTLTTNVLAGIIVAGTAISICLCYLIWRCIRTPRVPDFMLDDLMVPEALVPQPLHITIMRVQQQPQNPWG